MLKFLLLFFLFFINNGKCNEVVAIKTYDRDSYIRIMFETTEQPKYFVEQKNNNRIQVKLPNTIIKSNLHKNIYKLNVIDDIFLLNENDGIKFIIATIPSAKLMRYLYTEPSNITKYYRVIVDIYKNNKESVNTLISNKNLNSTKSNTINSTTSKNLSINDLIDRNIKEDKKETIDELMKMLGQKI